MPFFENIYNISGFPEAREVYGEWFTYQMNPRALIFRRDAPKVNDLKAARDFLRYNRWKTDPAAYGNDISIWQTDTEAKLGNHDGMLS